MDCMFGCGHGVELMLLPTAVHQAFVCRARSISSAQCHAGQRDDATPCSSDGCCRVYGVLLQGGGLIWLHGGMGRSSAEALGGDLGRGEGGTGCFNRRVTMTCSIQHHQVQRAWHRLRFAAPQGPTAMARMPSMFQDNDTKSSGCCRCGLNEGALQLALALLLCLRLAEECGIRRLGSGLPKLCCTGVLLCSTP